MTQESTPIDVKTFLAKVPEDIPDQLAACSAVKDQGFQLDDTPAAAFKVARRAANLLAVADIDLLPDGLSSSVKEQLSTLVSVQERIFGFKAGEHGEKAQQEWNKLIREIGYAGENLLTHLPVLLSAVPDELPEAHLDLEALVADARRASQEIQQVRDDVRQAAGELGGVEASTFFSRAATRSKRASDIYLTVGALATALLFILVATTFPHQAIDDFPKDLRPIIKQVALYLFGIFVIRFCSKRSSEYLARQAEYELRANALRTFPLLRDASTNDLVGDAITLKAADSTFRPMAPESVVPAGDSPSSTDTAAAALNVVRGAKSS